MLYRTQTTAEEDKDVSCNHTTHGQEAFDGFLKALEVAGIEATLVSTGKTNGEREFRKAFFMIPVFDEFKQTGHDHMIVEEYLAFRDDDCDDTDRIAIEVYSEEDSRPNLEARMRTEPSAEEISATYQEARAQLEAAGDFSDDQ